MDICVSGIAIPASAARGTPLPPRSSRPTSAKLGREKVSHSGRDQNRRHSSPQHARARVPTSSARQASPVSRGAQEGFMYVVDSGDPMSSHAMQTMMPAETALEAGGQDTDLHYLPGVFEDLELDGVTRSSKSAHEGRHSGNQQHIHSGMLQPSPGDNTGVTRPQASNDLRRELHGLFDIDLGGQQEGTENDGSNCLRGVVEDLLSDMQSPLDRLIPCQNIDQERSVRASESGNLQVGSKGTTPSHLPQDGKRDASVDGPDFEHSARVSDELHGMIQDMARVDAGSGVQSEGNQYLHGVLEDLASDFDQPSMRGALPSSTQLILPGDAPGPGTCATPKSHHPVQSAAPSVWDEADERLAFDDIIKLFPASGCDSTDGLIELFNQMKDEQGKVLLTELMRAPGFSRIFGNKFAVSDSTAHATQPMSSKIKDDLEPVAEALGRHALSRSGIGPVAEALSRHALLIEAQPQGTDDTAQASQPTNGTTADRFPPVAEALCQHAHSRSATEPAAQALCRHALSISATGDSEKPGSCMGAQPQGTDNAAPASQTRTKSADGSSPESIPLGDQAWDRLRKVFRRVEQKHMGEGWSWEHGPAQSAKVLCAGEVPTKEVIDEIRSDLQVRHQGLLARTIMAADRGTSISLDQALRHLEQLQDKLPTLTWERFYWLILEAPGVVAMDESTVAPSLAEAQARGCNIRIGPDGMAESSTHARGAEGRAASPPGLKAALSEWPFDPDQHAERATQWVVEELGLDRELMRRLFDVFNYCRRLSASPVRVVKQSFVDTIKANPNLSRDLAMTSLLPSDTAKERVYWGHVLLDLTCLDSGSIAWSDVLEVVRWNCAVSLGLVEQGMTGPGGLRPRVSHLTTPAINVSACRQRLDRILQNRGAHSDKHLPPSPVGMAPATAAESLAPERRRMPSPVNNDSVNGFRNQTGLGPLDGGRASQLKDEKHGLRNTMQASMTAAVPSLPPAQPPLRELPPRVPPVFDDPFADRSALHTWMEQAGVESPAAAVALGFARSVQGSSKAAEPPPANNAHLCRHPLLDYDSDEESIFRQAPAFPIGPQPPMLNSSGHSGHRMPSRGRVDGKPGQDTVDHNSRVALHGKETQRGQSVQNGASAAVRLRLSGANSSLSQQDLEAAVARLLDLPAASVKLRTRT